MLEKDSKQLIRRVVILILLIVVLVICLILYGLRSNDYALAQPAASFTPNLSNSDILQNWLPSNVYKSTLGSIDSYLRVKNLRVSYMTVQGNLTIDEANFGTYDFTILTEPQAQTYEVSVAVDNFSGIISSTVSINGQQQGYAVPSQSNSGIKYIGINNLVSLGVTSIQAGELLTAFQKFSPEAKTVTISAIVAPPINPTSVSLTKTYTFSVKVDGTNYKAGLNCISLSEIKLFLTNSNTNKQVFDSGILNQN